MADGKKRPGKQWGVKGWGGGNDEPSRWGRGGGQLSVVSCQLSVVGSLKFESGNLNQARWNGRGRLRCNRSPEGGTACRAPSDGSHGVACPSFPWTVPVGMNQTPGRVCGRLRLCRCPKGAAASREGSGINASGDAEAKEVASMWGGG